MAFPARSPASFEVCSPDSTSTEGNLGSSLLLSGLVSTLCSRIAADCGLSGFGLPDLSSRRSDPSTLEQRASKWSTDNPDRDDIVDSDPSATYSTRTALRDGKASM